MKRILITIITLFILTWNVAAQIDNNEITKVSLKSSLNETFTSIRNTEITYQAEENFFKKISDVDKNEFRKDIQYFKHVIEARKNGTLSPEDTRLFYLKSDEDLEASIAKREWLLDEDSKEAIYIFSTDGFRFRQDVYRPQVTDEDHSYIFDGINGFLVKTADNVVRSGDLFTEYWTNFNSFARFGSGLEKALQQNTVYNTDIISNNSGHHLIVENNSMQKKGIHLDFTLLDSNPIFWEKCEHKINNKTTLRIVCEDFKEHDGIMVPGIVRRQKPSKNGFEDEYVLTLLDVKINTVEFPENFFNPPTVENSIVHRLTR
ncbi:MAG: hypothetical protein P9L94_00250 [Candidatus Hinthialibacter antarcticus]|nr:hypothetical protein [Candidatus Hinthialibacter antarcticus]